MSDYIRREDAMKVLYNDYAYAAMDVIKRVPAADVAEVVHGRWKSIDGRKYLGVYCSSCTKWCDNKFAYCPNCGAKMDGDEADNE